jgi:hypothetical protein
VHLIIIDEVSMIPNPGLDILSDLLRRAKGMEDFDDPTYAGAVILSGGDLRQLAPICGEGELETDIHFRYSKFLESCQVISLRQNMRAAGAEADFARLLKEVGEGRQPTHRSLPPQSFIVPDEWIIPSQSLDELIQWCFGDNPTVGGRDAAILTHLNKDCREINLAVKYIYIRALLNAHAIH